MKKNITVNLALLLFCLLLQVVTSFAQTSKPTEKQQSDINNLYSLASEANVAEVVAFKDFMETLRKNPPASNEAACQYILGVRKFQRGNDELFDTLVASQRIGRTVTGQALISPEENIIYWASGRASYRVAINKLIGNYKCVPPEQVNEEIRNRIIGSLKNLGNLTAYIEEAKKIRTLNETSSKEDICAGFSAMKKESDKIEPDLKEFATLYVAEGDAQPTARTVEFAEPAITERAEKILNIRAKLFLPLKSDIKTNLDKYGCK